MSGEKGLVLREQSVPAIALRRTRLDISIFLFATAVGLAVAPVRVDIPANRKLAVIDGAAAVAMLQHLEHFVAVD